MIYLIQRWTGLYWYDEDSQHLLRRILRGRNVIKCADEVSAGCQLGDLGLVQPTTQLLSSGKQNKGLRQWSVDLRRQHTSFPTSRTNNITVTLIKKALIRNILKPDANSIYAVICRGDFSVSGFNGAWLKDWCGIIHTGFTLARDMPVPIP